AAAVVLVTGIEFWEAAVIAAVLAPTDAALGHAVVSSPRIPVRIRQTINVEAGLNDGLSIPFLFLFLGLAVDQASLDATAWFTFGVQQITLGAVIGILAGGGGGWLVQHAVRRGTITYSYERMVMVAIAVGSWALADQLGGNGFIAAFFAGLAIARFAHDFGERMLDFAEREGQLLSVIVFFIFGTAAIGFLGAMTWQIGVFVLVALTINRVVPVVLSLIGTGLDKWTFAFIGWFGPRGLASIILVLVVVSEEPGLPGLDIVLATVTATVLASVLLHGVSAKPFAWLYSSRVVERMPPEAPELTEGEVPRPRRV
ncbi:MAG: cation:proton antiporter, partial [Thermoleophilia bacterium]|nr:cation:proton antiporter [Thermoleophilia bacterium]